MAKAIRETPILKGTDAELFNLRATVNEQAKELSEREQVIRELIPIAEARYWHLSKIEKGTYDTDESEQLLEEMKKIDSIIERAKRQINE